MIYTIGHSTRDLETFMALLVAHQVGLVADVRRYPASRRYPHFAQRPLAAALEAAGIAYWRSAAFRGYADYMATPAFQQALARLITLAGAQAIAVMCAEAVPWRCHRQLIADALLARGVAVRHIVGAGEAADHRLSPHAQVLGDGQVRYPAGPPHQLPLG